MAKIMIEVDTDAKTMTVNVNGADVSNVREVNLRFTKDYYETEDELCVNICSYEEDEMGDVKKMTTLVASKSVLGKKAIKAGAKPHATDKSLVVLIEDHTARKDIAKCFGL